MRAPTSIMRMQTVTIFTPTITESAKPVNGGNARTYTKTVLNNVRYTLRGGISTSANVNATNDGFYVVIYDCTGYKTHWNVIAGESLIIPDNYTGNTPPSEGSGTQYYRVTNISERKTPDGMLHNIGISAQ